MGVINIRALFDWKDVQTGLERVRGQAERVGADLDKSFSVASMGRSLVGAFTGLKLVEILVNPLKETLAYLERSTTAGRAFADQMQRGFIGRNTPERQIPQVQALMGQKDADIARVDRQLADLPDFANSMYAQAVAKLSETMGLGGVPGSAAFKKNQFDQLTEERLALQSERQGLGEELFGLQRTTTTSARRGAAETSSIMDGRRVFRGEISQVEALENAAQRASSEYLAVLRSRGPGAEATEAFQGMLRAQDAAELARAPFERDRINGVLPQISSSSLAQLGGGGNVNVFGGRPGEGAELREHTRLLREISGKIGGPTLTGGLSGDIAP